MVIVQYEKLVSTPRISNKVGSLTEIKKLRFDTVKDANGWIEGVRSIDNNDSIKNIQIKG